MNEEPTIFGVLDYARATLTAGSAPVTEEDKQARNLLRITMQVPIRWFQIVVDDEVTGH